MRRLILFLPVLLSLFSCLGPEGLHPDRLVFEPLEFQVPQVQRRELSNGMILYLKEDHELPLVRITALVGGGSIDEPAEKAGMDGLFASTLRTGGAGDLSPDAFEEALEKLAANMSVSTDTYATTLGLSLLSEDLDRGLSLFSDLLRRPTFDTQRLEVARKQAIEGVRRQNDLPSSIARRIFKRAIYGEHPLGRTPTEETLSNVERDDLLAFHRRYFHPNNLRLALSGDFETELLVESLEKIFGGWTRGVFDPQQIPQVSQLPEPQLLLAHKDLPQTTILMGEIGIEKSNPDLYAVKVMNYILGGGGFNSRLMREVRSNRGLAYSVYSYYQVGRRLPGPFVAGAETKNASAQEVVGLMRDLMEGMRREPVSPDDLRTAKESLINSFVFAFDDSHAVVSQRMTLDFYGYPVDYLEKYREKMGAVTREDVLRVAREYLDSERQVILLVGAPEGVDPGGELFGRVVRDVSFENGLEGLAPVDAASRD